jgi:aminoglycoside phosphotransferase (APT) family kinase protein
VQLEPFGVGWDNVAYLINREFVFRFPRRELGARLLAAEMQLMPRLAPMLSLRVPDHEFQGTANDRFRWRFAGYRMIAGRTACRANLDATQRLAVAPALGRFLAALHHVPADFAQQLGAGPDPLGRFNMPYRVEQTRERLAYIAKHGLFDRIDQLLALADATARDYAPRRDTLVHGDLYSRHLIVDESAALVGVIDWGDVHLGDAAVDLMIAWTLLPPPAREAFFTSYGSVDPTTWNAARFRALNHTACVVPYAHETRDSHLLRESLEGLRNLLHD